MIDDDNNGGPNRRGSWMRGIGILLMLPIGLIAVLVLFLLFGDTTSFRGEWLFIIIVILLVALSSASRTDVQEGGIGGSSTGVRMDR